jgi:radical SAM superfamily enzyme YgiQ (UPF0313 family)
MIKKNVLLISANSLKEPYPIYPIGIAYLETYLNAHCPQFEVSVFDCNLNSLNELEKTLQSITLEYAGISLRNIDNTDSINSRQFVEGYISLVRCIKNNSKAKIILGGAGYSIFPELLFNYLQPNFGIIGEGEVSFEKLLISLEQKSDYKDIEGLVYRKGNEIIINPHLNYLESPSLEFNEKLIGYYWKNSGLMNIQTKRGCYYSCSYCTYPIIEGRNVRTFDIEKIIYSLKMLNSKFGVNYVFFTDSVFNLKPEYNSLLAEKLIDSGMDMKWGAYFTFNDLELDMLSLYKKAGLTHIEFGTDSISEKQLRNIGKQFTVSDVLEKSLWCTQLDINYAHFLILASYGETEETLNETFENSKTIEDTVFFPYIGARIYPRTRLANIAIAEKIIASEDELLFPKYYISQNVNLETIKERARKTGKKWCFPDDDISLVTKKLREKNRKGPLWEYLKYL